MEIIFNWFWQVTKIDNVGMHQIGIKLNIAEQETLNKSCVELGQGARDSLLRTMKLFVDLNNKGGIQWDVHDGLQLRVGAEAF